MKMTVALGPLLGVTGGVAMSTNDMVPLLIALGLVALHLAGHAVLLVLFVCRPADRTDLLKYIRAWRER